MVVTRHSEMRVRASVKTRSGASQLQQHAKHLMNAKRKIPFILSFLDSKTGAQVEGGQYFTWGKTGTETTLGDNSDLLERFQSSSNVLEGKKPVSHKCRD